MKKKSGENVQQAGATFLPPFFSPSSLPPDGILIDYPPFKQIEILFVFIHLTVFLSSFDN